MAAATPSSYVDNLIPFVRNRPFTTTQKATILNLAQDHFNSLALWRWLAFSETEITLDGSQEYTFTPASSILRVALIYLTTANGRFVVLPPTGIVPDTDRSENIPSTFSYRPSSGDAIVRLWPKPPSTFTAKMVPLSKLAHTRITTGNLSTASILLHPDSLDHVFSLFVLHYLYMFSQVGQISEVVHSQGPPTTRGVLAQALAAVDAIRPSDAILYDSAGQPYNL